MRIAKWNVLILTSVLALSFLGTQAACAAGLAKQNQAEPAAKSGKAQSVEVYRVDYKISELENGKIINSRSYSLMAKTDARASTRVDSRVPVSIGSETNFQYQNTGMEIDCIVTKQERDLLVHTEISMTTIAGKERSTSSGSHPVFRHLSLADDTVATVGKPAFVGSIDDVASNRRYVVEVTVTRAR